MKPNCSRRREEAEFIRKENPSPRYLGAYFQRNFNARFGRYRP